MQPLNSLRQRSLDTNQRAEVLVAVPGGSTPRACLTLLGQQDLPWPHIAVTLTDERDVPRDHPDSNFGLLRDTLFAGQALTERFVPLNKDAVSSTQHLPLVTLLGMGEDGHFASIFPDAAERDTCLMLDQSASWPQSLLGQSPSAIHADHGEACARRGGRAAHFW